MASSFDVPKRLHAAQHGAGGSDPITPADIGAMSEAEVEAAAQAAAAPAVAAAQSAQADAADAATRAENAEAASLEVPDLNVSALISNPASDTSAALDAVIDGKIAGVKVSGGFPYLDSFNWIGEGNSFVVGQSATYSTTTTATVAPAGSVIPVTSASGLMAGVSLVVSRGTPQQEIVVVQSVSGSDITLTRPLYSGIASGAAVAGLWANASHLTSQGYDAMAYWLANHPSMPNLAGKKVTLLGNSWFDGKAAWATRIMERWPSATVVNAGVSGNTSTAMLARFDAAVPTDSDYVVLDEPGVNDTLTTGHQTSLITLDRLLAKVESVGASPIVTGPVPLTGQGPKSALLATKVAALSRGDYVTALSPAIAATTTAVGDAAFDSAEAAGNNTAFGFSALKAATTTRYSTAVGSMAASTLTSDLAATAVGYYAGGSVDGTYVGAESGRLATGGYSTMVGRSAGHYPGGVAANSTTTGRSQTLVGFRTGQPTSYQSNYVTAVGTEALAGGGHYASAFAARARAEGAGSVAIGCDSSGTGAAASAINEFVLGTAQHRVKVPGRLNVSPRTPTGTADTSGEAGDIAADENYVYVKTSTGWKRAPLSAW